MNPPTATPYAGTPEWPKVTAGLLVDSSKMAWAPNTITFQAANREVLRITADGRLVMGEGLSAEEATQEAAKLLIASFAEQIQKMVDGRVAAMKEARTQPTEAHLKLARFIRRADDEATATTDFAEMIADSEARAVAAEREKVRVLREALERRHDEQSYHCQYVDAALAATKEDSP